MNHNVACPPQDISFGPKCMHHDFTLISADSTPVLRLFYVMDTLLIEPRSYVS